MESKTLSEAKIFVGIDIGGTLAKLCLSMPKKLQEELKFQHLDSLKIEISPNDVIYFVRFSTEGINELFQFIKKYEIHHLTSKFYVTGGGAYKFSELFQKELNVEVIKVNEFESLAKGLDYLNKNKSESAFRFSKKTGKIDCKSMKKDEYPFLLVNIGSGVSFLKFSEANKFERITGTCVGGGTFLGLCNLITGVNDFEELLSLSNEGDDRKIDLFVKDIYGGTETPHMDLDSSTLAISLGKLKEGNIDFKKADIILSLLHMIAFNIGQVSYLVAKLHKIDRVYFAGNFIRNHEETMDCINYAFDFFSQKDEDIKIAVFLSHDGYLGALGTLLISEFDKIKI